MKKNEMNSMAIKSSATLTGVLLIALTAVGCGKTTTTTATDAVAPITVTEAVGLIESGVTVAGSGLGVSSSAHLDRGLFDAKIRGVAANLELTKALCSEHGMPIKPVAEGGTDMNYSDARYPAIHTYCSLTVNSGDTVVGGFSMAKSLVCSLEKAGLEFAGKEQTLNITFDSECWPNGGPEDSIKGKAVQTGSAYRLTLKSAPLKTETRI